MLTSVVAGIRNVRQYAELEGARVLLTGVSTEIGADIARGFAEVGARMVVHMTPARNEDEQARNGALLRILANTATEVRATEHAIGESEEAVRFAQGAAQAFGGLDAVVNIVAPAADSVTAASTVDEIEAAVSNALRPACLITRIAANRMSLTWTEGLVLNAVLAPAPRSRSEGAFNCILGQALAAMTRTEAAAWATKGIRINAVGPRSAGLTTDERAPQGIASEADVTALALHLASKRGRSLSGHMLDADGIVSRRC